MFVSDNMTVSDAFCVPAIGQSLQHTDDNNKPSVNVGLGQPLCDLRVCTPQPSELWPSDHFLLITDIDF